MSVEGNGLQLGVTVHRALVGMLVRVLEKNCEQQLQCSPHRLDSV